MTQSIDKTKLRESAEHLEWVLNQYPENAAAQGLLKSLLELINEAKFGNIDTPVERQDIPGTRDLGEGTFIPYKNPSIDDAYVSFSIQMRGGLSEKEKQSIAQLEAIRKGMNL